ncbi:ribosome-associated translation inhibitor RaiA [Parashewanella spongiae]|uniref:Ribosome-associated translation inhibitor RaiA n=1 Tax=Parashewanella spongiae TaxID=342950 RepID=A0A3A6TA88_9GAMM|nr:ribosome-associated translation inhibitor RaiA [Parashewanella spongiae]MCL1080074.1 ribosome-associated translation inhibitor RaiA [Parashewanella spongiae]RJY04907.1 ribosome-associated translation inhibitor RaiA [Parashewanella spongiae]
MLKITSKHLEVTPTIRKRVEARYAKLARHDVPLINPHIIITKEKQIFKIETSVGIPNGKLFAHAKNENLYAAITAMGQKLEKQLNRTQDKPTAQRYTTPEQNEEFIYDADLDNEHNEEYAA